MMSVIMCNGEVLAMRKKHDDAVELVRQYEKYASEWPDFGQSKASYEIIEATSLVKHSLVENIPMPWEFFNALKKKITFFKSENEIILDAI